MLYAAHDGALGMQLLQVAGLYLRRQRLPAVCLNRDRSAEPYGLWAGVRASWVARADA